MHPILFAIVLRLLSPQFTAGSRLGDAHVWNHDGCRGGNQSPALRWSAPPRGTKSFALSVFDPDAGRVGWWHWIAYDIPAARRSLPAAVPASGAGFTQGMNDFGAAGYGGPCPPPGPAHHYVFTLFALDVAHLRGPRPLRGTQFWKTVTGHVLATATLAGTYGR